MYKNNTIEGDLYNVYKAFNNRKSEIINKFPLPIADFAFGNVYVNIEDVLTEDNTGLEFESSFFGPIHLFGNINGSVGVGLNWINQDIKKTFLDYVQLFLINEEDKRNTLLEIENKYGEKTFVKASHASIESNTR